MENLKESLQDVHQNAHLVRSSHKIELIASRSVRFAVGLDSAYFTSAKLFAILVKSLRSDTLAFIHHYDQIQNPPWSDSFIKNRTTIINAKDSKDTARKFSLELDEFDPINVNFNFGCVIPRHRFWIGICLEECETALLLILNWQPFQGTAEEGIKKIAFDPTSARERVSRCLTLPKSIEFI